MSKKTYLIHSFPYEEDKQLTNYEALLVVEDGNVKVITNDGEGASEGGDNGDGGNTVDVSALEAKITSLETKVAELETKLEEANTKYTDLDSRISVLESAD